MKKQFLGMNENVLGNYKTNICEKEIELYLLLEDHVKDNKRNRLISYCNATWMGRTYKITALITK